MENEATNAVKDEINEVTNKKHISETTDFSEFKSDRAIRLNFGSGNNKKEGFINIDISENVEANIIMDLQSYPWDNFANDSVFEINCDHFIEHVIDIKSFMEECYRILSDKGLIKFLAPYWSSVRAWQDHTHVREISEMTFMYFSKEALKGMNLNQYDIDCDFKIESTRYYFETEWISRSDVAREFARKHYNNVVRDIEITLRAIK